jgi:hypothetical protein
MECDDGILANKAKGTGLRLFIFEEHTCKHHGYSSLEFEERAKLRAQLIELLAKDGIKGIKDFSRRLRQERRIRPKTVL